MKRRRRESRTDDEVFGSCVHLLVPTRAPVATAITPSICSSALQVSARIEVTCQNAKKAIPKIPTGGPMAVGKWSRRDQPGRSPPGNPPDNCALPGDVLHWARLTGNVLLVTSYWTTTWGLATYCRSTSILVPTRTHNSLPRTSVMPRDVTPQPNKHSKRNPGILWTHKEQKPRHQRLFWTKPGPIFRRGRRVVPR
ncbi:uncharacterized protein YALI1_A06220g [Yarrowia lipolytica]|jgi:hypothetical protein|uniref:Uncharacterized protein n=1 Tax=Yarrowia lipolytica TaxID=4952 RepID=A0A1D8N3X1_YARLL|nr:hypothetical protein YALI1_A06220g [Yarrowia lipolytica]